MNSSPNLVSPARPLRLAGLDHLRAFAISFVFIFHYSRLFGHPDWINSIGKFGWTGVDLFFVLSGYLIAGQLFAAIARNGSFSFRTFFIRRFFRIIPPYLLVVALYFLFPVLHEREGLAPLWKYLTFTQNIGLDLRTQGTFSHAWSLCIEEQFYLLLPVTLLALIYFRHLKKGPWLILLLFISGIVLRTWIWKSMLVPLEDDDNWGIYWYKWIYYPSYARLDSLLVGVALAAVFQFRPRIKNFINDHVTVFLLAGLAILVGAYFICEDETSFTASVVGFPVIGIGYGLLVAAAVSPACFLYSYASRMTRFIATLSYLLYLTHKMVIHVVQVQLTKLGIEKDSNLMLVACIIAAIGVSWLLYRLLEKPMARLRDKILDLLVFKRIVC